METTKNTIDQGLVEAETRHKQHIRFPEVFLPKIGTESYLPTHSLIFLICCGLLPISFFTHPASRLLASGSEARTSLYWLWRATNHDSTPL